LTSKQLILLIINEFNVHTVGSYDPALYLYLPFAVRGYYNPTLYLYLSGQSHKLPPERGAGS
jgi:hypothetical protein